MLRVQGFRVDVTADITRFQAIATMLAMDAAGFSSICYTPAVDVARRLGIESSDEVLIAAIQAPTTSAYPSLLDSSLIAGDIFLLDRGVVNVRFTKGGLSGRSACEVVVAFDSFLKQPDKAFWDFRDQLLVKLQSESLSESVSWSEMPDRNISGNPDELESIPNMRAADPPLPGELRAARALANADLRREFIALKRRKGNGGSFLDQMSKAGLVQSTTDPRPSALGKRLSDKSRWMRILAVSTLLEEGLAASAIRVPADDSSDEDDLVFALGDVFVCELKDEHFHEGHAKKFAARIFPMDIGVIALVIGSGPISPEARDYLDRVISRQGPDLPVLFGSRRKQVRFLEGDASVTRKLKDLVRAHSADAIASEFRVDGIGRGFDISTILMLKLIPVRDLMEAFAKTPEGVSFIRELRSRKATASA